MIIVDAHLDLAYNVGRGRDVTRPAGEQPACGKEIATVGLPDLRAGGVGLICATIFCMPDTPEEPGYQTPDQAHEMAWRQIEWYRKQDERGELRIVSSRADVSKLSAGRAVDAIILLEGGDPIRTPDDVTPLFAAGVRIVGLAWRRTRHAGGTREPGGLSELGRATVRELDKHGIIHDASHLAEKAFWELLDLSAGAVIASHSNCRAIVPGDRQLSDEMIRAIIARGGVIGINFFDRFLMPPDEHEGRRCTLDDVFRHVRHICDIAGSADHVGLGTDMDGGLGREQIPAEIRTSADLPRVASALSDAGMPDRDAEAIMGRNWLRYFSRHLAGP
jgi:membrane dipeptidase